MVVRVIISFIILCVLSYAECRQSFAISEELEYHTELEKRLQILNKPPVKTIIMDGSRDVYDCIHINEQPALDHPALRNHKIQLRPTFSPLSSKPSSKIGKTSVKLRGSREACPEDTVPIKRTTKEDLIRSDIELMKDEEDSSKKAVLTLANKGKLLGSLLNMALYNLSIGDDQKSSSEVRLEAGPPGQTDVLSVGWKVSKILNGDGFPRLFGYWHDGTNDKGCYDTFCPGFVQVNQEVPINYLFPRLSVYGEVKEQYSVLLAIQQDSKKGNWWLYAGDDSTAIGYWPNELFKNLGNGSDLISWGGVASPGGNGDFPPMGNGHLPDGFYKDTCYFDSVRYVNSADEQVVLAQTDTKVNVDSPGCYDLLIQEPSEELKISRFSFMFGGPGGKCA